MHNLPFRRKGLLRWVGTVILAGLIAWWVGLPVGAQDAAPKIVGSDQVIEGDLYLRGETVAVDGTINGNAFISGDEVTINGTIRDDLYVSGGQIILAGDVGGDAIAAGAEVTLRGSVAEDLLVAGRRIVVAGSVGDDIRMAGQVLQLEDAQVADDLIVAGASLQTAPNSIIGGNLNAAVGQADLAGSVQGNWVGGLGSARLSGTVDGNTNLAIGGVKPRMFWPQEQGAAVDVPAGLTLTGSSRIGGNLNYRAPQAATIDVGAQVGGDIDHQTLPTVETPFLSQAWAWGLLQRFLALLVVGALLLWWRPGWVQTLAGQVQAKPWPSLGWGALAVVLLAVLSLAIAATTLILTVLLGFTLQGLALPVFSLGSVANLLLLVSFGVFVAFIPQVVIGFWGGHRLLQSWGATSRYGALILGLVLFVLVTSIPVVGAIVSGVVILLGLGALWLWLRPQRSRSPAATAAPS